MNPTGTPYKYEKIIQTHNRFVQDVRFSPSGDVFASVGSDARVFLYDGKTGETKANLGEGVHSGTIVCLNCDFLPLSH
jgi:WD repeat-containing protein 1 (actin-interacting protein 1)